MQEGLRVVLDVWLFVAVLALGGWSACELAGTLRDLWEECKDMSLSGAGAGRDVDHHGGRMALDRSASQGDPAS
jgi:hypothetical protein